jgi:phenylacetate-CoA ligase
MAVAITNAEPVFEHQRSTIAQAFNCPVRETYGMAETVVCATECTAGKLHLWPEAGLVEVVGENRSLPDGTAGDLICTGLLNIDMPLIRYRTGDRGALACGHEPCRCGRNLPVIESVDGRIDDLVYTMDGRRIGRITPIFSGDLPIREAQIIQEALDRVKIRYVPAPGFNPDHECVIRQRLQDRMGAVEVIMEPVDVIARGPNGKFRGVINELSKDVRNALSV